MHTDIFQYFRDDDKHMEERLARMVEQYPNWSFDQVLEESKKVFAAIKEHFHRKEPLLTKTVGNIPELKSTIKQLYVERDAIDNEVENLVMIHVNEPSYKRGLEALLLKMQNNRKFCDKTVYPLLQEHIPKEELHRISDKLENQVLS